LLPPLLSLLKSAMFFMPRAAALWRRSWLRLPGEGRLAELASSGSGRGWWRGWIGRDDAVSARNSSPGFSLLVTFAYKALVGCIEGIEG